MKPLFKPYEAKRAYHEIAETISQTILAKRLKAGDRLPSERMLAEQFQVGRLTVREALRTLETKGLITIRHGRGGGAFVGVPDRTVIPSIIMDNLQLEGLTSLQLTEARIGLECAIITYAIEHATKSDLERIERNIEESREFIGTENARSIVDRMIDFHILLGESTHNLPFILFIRTLMEWARRKLVHWIPSEEEQTYSYQAHKKILDSVKHKNITVAQKRMKTHIVKITAFATRNH